LGEFEQLPVANLKKKTFYTVIYAGIGILPEVLIRVMPLEVRITIKKVL
jgi:hypothetical protein